MGQRITPGRGPAVLRVAAPAVARTAVGPAARRKVQRYLKVLKEA